MHAWCCYIEHCWRKLQELKKEKLFPSMINVVFFLSYMVEAGHSPRLLLLLSSMTLWCLPPRFFFLYFLDLTLYNPSILAVVFLDFYNLLVSFSQIFSVISRLHVDLVLPSRNMQDQYQFLVSGLSFFFSPLEVHLGSMFRKQHLRFQCSLHFFQVRRPQDRLHAWSCSHHGLTHIMVLFTSGSCSHHGLIHITVLDSYSHHGITHIMALLTPRSYSHHGLTHIMVLFTSCSYSHHGLTHTMVLHHGLTHIMVLFTSWSCSHHGLTHIMVLFTSWS